MDSKKRMQDRARFEARLLKVFQPTVAGKPSRAVAEQLRIDGSGSVTHTKVQKNLRTILW